MFSGWLWALSWQSCFNQRQESHQPGTVKFLLHVQAGQPETRNGQAAPKRCFTGRKRKGVDL